MRRHNELAVRKNLQKLRNHQPLPLRMQVKIDFVDHHNPCPSQRVVQGRIRDGKSACQIANQGNHALLAVGQLVDRQTLPVLFHLHSQGISPNSQILEFRQETAQSLANSLKLPVRKAEAFGFDQLIKVLPVLVLQVFPLTEPFKKGTEICPGCQCVVVGRHQGEAMLFPDSQGNIQHRPINRVVSKQRKIKTLRRFADPALYEPGIFGKLIEAALVLGSMARTAFGKFPLHLALSRVSGRSTAPRKHVSFSASIFIFFSPAASAEHCGAGDSTMFDNANLGDSFPRMIHWIS